MGGSQEKLNEVESNFLSPPTKPGVTNFNYTALGLKICKNPGIHEEFVGFTP
jgi:hypothetical protein